MVKIHWVFIGFLRMSENDVFRTGGLRFVLDQNFPPAHIIYYKYSYTDFSLLSGCLSVRDCSLSAVPPSPSYPTLIANTPERLIPKS